METRVSNIKVDMIREEAVILKYSSDWLLID